MTTQQQILDYYGHPAVMTSALKLSKTGLVLDRGSVGCHN